MKIAAHVHSFIFEVQKCKEGILINRYLLVYFLFIDIASKNWELQARLQETIVSSAIFYTIYVSSKKKQAYAYSFSYPLTCVIHGRSCTI